MFSVIVVLIILIIVLNVRNSWHKESPKTTGPNQYNQGYWDGYRALGNKIQDELNGDYLNREALQEAVNIGFGQAPAPSVDSLANIETMSIEEPQQVAEKTSLRNMNTILYMASFLLVAAVASFIATAMPDTVKLISVWLLAAAFYGVGYGLYDKMPNLRPAATAFLGTGLAIIPFAGFALQEYSAISGDWAWFIASFVGIIGYYVAAVRLQNQLVSYLTMAFVLSLVSSAVATMSAPIVWYFILLITVSLVANLISLAKPSWTPEVFKRPIEDTGQWVTPLALLASLFVMNKLSLANYEVLFGVATANYLVSWLQSRRFEYETAARLLMHITALLVGWDFANGDLVLFGYVFLTVAVAQLAYSLLRINNGSVRLLDEKAWMYVSIALQIISVIFWTQVENRDILSVVSLGLALASSIVFALRLRHVPVLVIGLVVSLIIPAIVMFNIIEPALDSKWLMVWYGLVAVAIMSIWRRIPNMSVSFANFLMASFLTYSVVAGLVTVSMSQGESIVALLALSAVVWAGSYLLRKPEISALGNLGIIMAILQFGEWINIEADWKIVAPMAILALVFYYSYWLMAEIGDTLRRQIQLIFTWTAFGIGILAGYFVDSTELVVALMIVAVAITIGVEGWFRQKFNYIEWAVYIATFGLQRACEILVPELNMVLYAHWWAMTIVAVGMWRRTSLKTRAIVGMSLITFATGIFALSEGGSYQLLFLVENIALLVAGALMRRTWAIWWGISASTLAILWFLRDYSFLALGFLGLVLIGIVVWRLNKKTAVDNI